MSPEKRRNMEETIEYVGFYPDTTKNNKQYIGTVHLYLTDIDADLRGIRVYRKTKKNWFFTVPHTSGMDEDTKEMVWYPTFSFTSKERNQKIFDFLHQKCIKLILNELKEKKFPPKPSTFKKKYVHR